MIFAIPMVSHLFPLLIYGSNNSLSALQMPPMSPGTRNPYLFLQVSPRYHSIMYQVFLLHLKVGVLFCFSSHLHLLSWEQINIQNGHCSEWFLHRKVFIPKSFYSERSFFQHTSPLKFIIFNGFYYEESLFQSFFFLFLRVITQMVFVFLNSGYSERS